MSLNSKGFYFFLLLPLAVWGAPKPPSVLLSADSYRTNPDQTADLEGNVRVARDGEVLTCDRAHVNNATGDVLAEGNITFITVKDFIKAERMSYNFLTKKGIITRGLIQTGQETIEGEEIIKTGDDQFLAHDATYTSCVNCPPSWKLSGRKIDATVGGYAYVSQPLFKLYSIPVLWLPWIAIPIKNQRQSGLLAPSFAVGGRNGSSFGETYFWAIDRSKDATIGATYFDLRGTKTDLEYRFVSNVNSRGTFNANYISDRLFPNVSDTRYNFYRNLDQRYNTVFTRPVVNDFSRYAFRYRQHVELPENYTSNINLNMVRDTQYIYDFPDDMPGAGSPALENRMNFAKNTENTHSSLDVDIYQNLLLADPIASSTNSVHRVPELKYSLIPQNVFSKGYLGIDVNYVNFMSSGKTFYDPNGSETFTALSKYKTGQRMILHPYLSFPFNVYKIIELVPQVEYEMSHYQFGYGENLSADRGFLRASISAKTRMSAIYGENDPKANKIKHEIIPELSYGGVPQKTFFQSEHAFFGSTTTQIQPSFTTNQAITEFDTLQFDYRDRVADRELISASLTNKLIRKKIGDGNYREILLHRVSQSYDAFNDKQPDYVNGKRVIKRPYSEIRSLFELKLDHFFITSDLSYYAYEVPSKTLSSTTVGLKHDRGDALTVGYNQGFQISPNYLDSTLPPLIFGAPSQTVSFGLKFVTKYLDMDNTIAINTLKGTGLGEPASFSTVGLLKPPGKCWGFAFTYRKVFGPYDPTFSFSIPIYFGDGRSFDVSRPN